MSDTEKYPLNGDSWFGLIQRVEKAERERDEALARIALGKAALIHGDDVGDYRQGMKDCYDALEPKSNENPCKLVKVDLAKRSPTGRLLHPSSASIKPFEYRDERIDPPPSLYTDIQLERMAAELARLARADYSKLENRLNAVVVEDRLGRAYFGDGVVDVSDIELRLLKLLEEKWSTGRARASVSIPDPFERPGILEERLITVKDFIVRIEHGPTSFGAYVPGLPGCVAVGQSEDEVIELIDKAITMHLEGIEKDELVERDRRIWNEALKQGDGDDPQNVL